MFSINYKEFIETGEFTAFQANVRNTSLYCVAEMNSRCIYYLVESDLDFFMEIQGLKGLNFELKMEAAKILGSRKMWVKEMLRKNVKCPDLEIHLRKISHSADTLRIEKVKKSEELIGGLLSSATEEYASFLGKLRYKAMPEGKIVSKGESHFLRKSKEGLSIVNNLWLSSRQKLADGKAVVNYENSSRAKGIAKLLQLNATQSNLSARKEEAA